MADDGEAAHLLDVAVRIGDDPVAGDQLRRDVAAVLDGDGVSEGELSGVRDPTARAGDERPRSS
jgi:hypothetical protein